ncbi:HDOD domain-containing protein [Marinobacter sp. MBR-99]|uniref:HDOD domain-containing protein n=1 Tax=Marinobacter sp. MBR-99 TaxID=3156461 RepID=UPI003393D3F0
MDIAADLQLPSLPEITLRALKACQAGDSYREISQIVATDTALVARLLSLANSALYRTDPPIGSVEQALLRLGTRRFQTLLLTSALRQLLFELGGDEWQQLRDFWRHSLTTALTARALATLTRYPGPEEAFLLGMVHNIGELIAIKTPTTERKQEILNHQNEIAAHFVTGWGLGPLAADAMRYQQSLPTQLRDASHLVKLISLSTRLALSDSAGIAAAGTIFGLQEDLTREICGRINEEVVTMAASFGIPLDTPYQGDEGTRRLRDTLINQAIASRSLDLRTTGSTTPSNLIASTVSSLGVLTGLPALCFGPDSEELRLLSGTGTNLPDLRLSPQPGGSVLTDAWIGGKIISLGEREPTVLDRQLLTLLRTPSLMAIPVQHGGQAHAVFALGLDSESLVATTHLVQLFTHELTQLIDSQTTEEPGIDSEIAHDRIRRQVHEVSNPLTIIRQYIFQLRARMSDETIQDDLDIIQEELDRAGNLLLQISTSDTTGASGGTDLNRELESLARILQDSLFNRDDRTLKLNPCREDTLVQGGASGVRQIIINLIRNAVESLEAGSGEITVSTKAPIFQSQRRWVELQIIDNGPGIPESVRRNLFAPVASSKGQGHSGLGLSIVKQLIDDMEGIIACHTGQEGTTFRILLPAAGHEKHDTD